MAGLSQLFLAPIAKGTPGDAVLLKELLPGPPAALPIPDQTVHLLFGMPDSPAGRFLVFSHGSKAGPFRSVCKTGLVEWILFIPVKFKSFSLFEVQPDFFC